MDVAMMSHPVVRLACDRPCCVCIGDGMPVRPRSTAGCFADVFIPAPARSLTVACLIVNDEALSVAAPLLMLPVMLFSGLTAVNIPRWLSWIGYLVYLQYGLAIMMTNEFVGLTFTTCSPLQAAQPTVPSGLPSTAAPANATVGGGCVTVTGEEYLSNFEFLRFTIGQNFGIMLGISCVIQLIGWLALERLVRQRKA